MRNLLCGGLIRLCKNRGFWLNLIFMFGFGVFASGINYRNMLKYHEDGSFDKLLFAYILFLGCCIAVFCSIFIGTEYSDGTIRNKIIIGCTRSSIYFSNLVLSIIASYLMVAAFLLSYCTIGKVLLDPSQMPAGSILFYILVSLLTSMAFASLFTMFTMLITQKSTAATVCLLVFFGLLIAAASIKLKLETPEFIQTYSVSSGVVETSESAANPNYIKGAARDIYQFFYDFLPTGQSLQLSGKNVAHPAAMAVYSLCITAGTTMGGIFIFRKKNLK